MNAQPLKIATLKIAVAKMFVEGNVKTQDDIVQVARVVMTDLEVDFKAALALINEVITTVSEIQDLLLNA